MASTAANGDVSDYHIIDGSGCQDEGALPQGRACTVILCEIVHEREGGKRIRKVLTKSGGACVAFEQ